ncbi:MAG: phosphonoacetaldehyde reductase [Spirochaetales bacterium]|nr:phosphonoacetaldehyde reductase [Spirochaetales bacterium]
MTKQKLVSGKGSIYRLKALMEENSWQKAFIVSDRNAYRASGAERKIAGMCAPGSLTVFDDFSVNPKLEDVLSGIGLFHSVSPDVIIAAGGGSAMDMAKLINSLAADKDNAADYIKGRKKIEKAAVPLIAVPTTAGTGSEATRFAVVYIDKVKYSLAGPSMKPEYVILDPELTESLPAYITGCTVMDALCQAMESLWSVNSTAESAECAEKAIRLILEEKDTISGDIPLSVREKFQKAAYLAGKAIDITTTTAAHALSYYLTSYHHIPHGHAVGLLFGWVYLQNWKVNDENCNHRKGPESVKKTLSKITGMFSAGNMDEFIEYFYTFMGNAGLDINAVEFTDEIIENLFGSVNVQRLNNNPVVLDLGKDAIKNFKAFFDSLKKRSQQS